MLPWYKQKTTWSGIGAIIVAVGGIVSGTIDVPTAIEMIVTALLAIFLRQGVEKSKPQ